MKNNSLFLVLMSSLILCSCSGRALKAIPSTLCSVAITPYALGAAAYNHHGGDNAEYLQFKAAKRSCERQNKEAIKQITLQQEKEEPYKTLWTQYVDPDKVHPSIALTSISPTSSTARNSIENYWKPKLQKDGEYYTYIGPKQYAIKDTIDLLELVEKNGWDVKYQNQYKFIMKSCLLQKYTGEELEKLWTLEYRSAPMPKSACVVF